MALVTPIGRRELTNPGALLRGHRIQVGLAHFAAGQNPRLMEVTLGTTAGEFATLATEQVKGTRGEGFIALKMAQEAAECGVGSPQTLAALGEFGAQSVLRIYVHDTDCQAKFRARSR
jgi:hypothetical protein